MEGNWGFNKIMLETYFLENGKIVDEWCTLKQPKKIPCPHYTMGEPIETIYTKEPAIYAIKGKYTLPENIRLLKPNSNRVYYIGMDSLKYIKPLMNETNYYPVVIEGFKIDGKSYNFLDKLVNEINKIGRSIVLENSYDLVLPNYVKYLDN